MTDNSYDRYPKKRSAAGAILLNERGEMLVVNPTYKDHWEFPGGIIEDNESPRQACLREVKEEIGLDRVRADLIGLDYERARGQKTETYQFIFYCGTITDEDISRITLPEGELSDYRFVSQEEAQALLGPRRGNRLKQMLKARESGTSAYLEDGRV